MQIFKRLVASLSLTVALLIPSFIGSTQSPFSLISTVTKATACSTTVTDIFEYNDGIGIAGIANCGGVIYQFYVGVFELPNGGYRIVVTVW